MMTYVVQQRGSVAGLFNIINTIYHRRMSEFKVPNHMHANIIKISIVIGWHGRQPIDIPFFMA